MAFSTQAQQVIRAYQVAEGRLPTQAELDAMAGSTSLVSVINTMVLGLGQTTRDQFVRQMYENAGIEPDDEGLAYWANLLRGDETGRLYSRAEVVEAFQYLAAKDHPDSTLGQATTTAAAEGLTGENLQFRDPSQGEDGDDEGPADFDGTVKFNTSVEDRDGAATDKDGAFDQRLAESADHTIFNIGMNELVGNGSEMQNTTTTADYNLVIENQLGKDGVYQGLFLSPVIAPTITVDDSQATLRVRVADRLAPADDVDNTLDSVSVPFFTFFLNGQPVRIESEEMADARNYEDLVAATQNEVARLQEAGQLDPSVKVELGAEFREDRYVRQPDGTRVQEGEVVGKEIVITTTAGELQEGTVQVISAGERGIDPVGYGLDQFVPGGSNQVIETDLTLNNVGYGSQGGSINITGQSASNKGIDKFNIEASNGVWLTTLMSANGHQNSASPYANEHLRQVELTGQGYFNIGKQAGSSIQDSSEAGLFNVTHFNAAGFNGSVRLDSDIYVNNSAVNYNLGGSDNQLLMDAWGSNLDINIRTGSGNDVINVNVNSQTVGVEGSGLNITTTGGNNVVNVSGGASYATMHTLQNLEINTGAGVDSITVDGKGTFDIDAGAGNDVIFINANGGVVQWSYGNPITSTTFGYDNFDTRVLYEAKLEVSFAGFETEFTVPTGASNNFVADQKLINQAIKDAIEGDGVLNELLTVTLSHNGQVLNVTSKYDGKNDLKISLNQPGLTLNAPAEGSTDVRVNATHLDALKAGAYATGDISDSSATNDQVVAAIDAGDVFTDIGSLLGSNAISNVVNFSSIDAGRGQDIVVMSSNEDSANQLVISGQFDDLTVVNFFNNDGNVGNHALDFRDLLDGKTDSSDNNNSLSERPVEIISNTGANAQANSVSWLEFDATTTDNTVSWNQLNVQTLVAALNGTAATNVVTGGILANMLTPEDAVTDFVGTTQKHIVMVENAANPGEYKVFLLTSTLDNTGAVNTATVGGTEVSVFNTSGSQLLGTIDFGASVDTNGFDASNLVGGTFDLDTLVDNAVDSTFVPTTPEISLERAAEGFNANGQDISIRVPLGNYVETRDVNVLYARSVEFNFDFGQTLTLTEGSLIQAFENLTVSGGTVDATDATLNVTGTITLNSGLIITAAQAQALQAAVVTFTSESDTPSKIVIKAADGTETEVALDKGVEVVLSGNADDGFTGSEVPTEAPTDAPTDAPTEDPTPEPEPEDAVFSATAVAFEAEVEAEGPFTWTSGSVDLTNVADDDTITVMLAGDPATVEVVLTRSTDTESEVSWTAATPHNVSPWTITVNESDATSTISVANSDEGFSVTGVAFVISSLDNDQEEIVVAEAEQVAVAANAQDVGPEVPASTTFDLADHADEGNFAVGYTFTLTLGEEAVELTYTVAEGTTTAAAIADEMATATNWMAGEVAADDFSGFGVAKGDNAEIVITNDTLTTEGDTVAATLVGTAPAADESGIGEG